jgi:hypothetical protein
MRAVTSLMTTDNLNYSIMSHICFFWETSTDSKMLFNIKWRSITLMEDKKSPLEKIVKEI